MSDDDDQPDDSPMTVTTLVALLKKLPGDLQVIVSKDAEGNGFSPVYEHSVGKYMAECDWSGNFYAHDDDDAEGEPCVVLWPTN